ncbi:hypothetical protein [Bradyrhizobium sp. sBnM-33]|uniref:hypothetical protein n=1 Tax=Bradyrhizobium sp. sBnM-33 TaxID=2831780 RepID=UPI001BCC93BC|nr:hypothetical protein [Bradyrhizobium sp. sBnM-33]WOH48289.1 hypothetical protein RX328_29745 [Bradyrhizobium sp. sBnM-33]
MEYYVGLDVSLKQTSICVVDQTGSVVREGVVDSDPEAISVYVRSKAPDAVRIGPDNIARARELLAVSNSHAEPTAAAADPGKPIVHAAAVA